MATKLTRAWTRLLGSDLAEGQVAVATYAYSIAATTDQSVYVTGTTSSQSLAFVSKYDADGSKIWTRLLGLPIFSEAWAVSSDNEGSAYIAGSSSGDAFIVKYQSDGSKAWTQLLGTSGSETAYSVSTSNDGSVYIAGVTSSTSLDGQSIIGNYYESAFIAKYTSDGSKLWTRILGAGGSDKAFSVSAATDGSVYIAGSTSSSSLDGKTNSGRDDAFLTKYASDGSKVWTQLLGAGGYEIAYSVSTSIDGSAYIAGYTSSPNLDGQGNGEADTVFIAKYDGDGAKIWTRVLALNGFTPSVATDIDGSVYITGTTSTPSVGGQMNSGFEDAFIVKYNANGSLAWTQLYGAGGSDWGRFVSSGNDGSIYIAGYTSSAILDAQTSSGNDAFIVRYDSRAILEDISVNGRYVILQYSQAVSAASVPVTAFKVETINKKKTIVNCAISSVELDQNNETRVILALSGKSPGGSINLRVSYTDPLGDQAAGVVQDALGKDAVAITNQYADTFFSGSTATIASEYKTLILTGDAAINGTGNILSNTILGNSAKNVILGGLNGDILTGMGGVDIFKFSLADSKLSAMDHITDLVIGTDFIDGSYSCTAAKLTQFGSVASLAEADIATVLNSSVFLANRAATFTYGSGASQQAFLVLNNRTKGFQSAGDAIIEITGFTGELTNLAVI